MGLWGFNFGSNSNQSGSNEIPEIYPFRGLTSQQFIEADITATYTKILTDTLERTHGLDKKQIQLLWDNCVQSESTDGLVSLLVKAMVEKSELYLVYKKDVNVLRKATTEEQKQIKDDYAKKSESKAGVYISFKNYKRTDMLRIYSELEYCVLASLYKTVNISKAVQIKTSDLRSSVSLADSGLAATQAKSMADALRSGKDVLLDAKDEITTATPNIEPTEKAILFLDGKKAFILGYPLSYISGEQTTGIGSTGEADTKAVERGHKQYFFTIIHPVLLAIFGVDTTFKSQDFRTLTSALEALKAFELASNTVLSSKAKQEIVARLFDLDPKEEIKNLEDDAENAQDEFQNEEIDDEEDSGNAQGASPKRGRGNFGRARAQGQKQ